MLHHIEVSNFRGLEKFRMERLGRVNLLVGTNNCGKTSVLEAISILMEQGSWGPLYRSLSRRGEAHNEEFEIAHMFYGHRVSPGTTFTIHGKNGDSNRRVEAQILERDPKDPGPAPRAFRWGEVDDVPGGSPHYLAMSWSRDEVRQDIQLQISKRGGIFDHGAYIVYDEPQEGDLPILFITTESLSHEQVASLLEQVMLTPEEETLLTALHTIEPGIERIASVGVVRQGPGERRRGGVAVKLAGQRVPIGSLGDGIWRLLGIALALVRARGGVLLVDEIDTGLHYSVLEKMWHLVYETAKRLDVQVFATTHSRDCYESLAAIAQPTGHDVTIQRIERGKPVAVAFSEAEILQAAERGIEVR